MESKIRLHSAFIKISILLWRERKKKNNNKILLHYYQVKLKVRIKESGSKNKKSFQLPRW